MKTFIYLLTLSIALGIPQLEAKEISPENAHWKIFTNRQWITSFSLQENSNTLWVATDGGLEKREATTGKLSQIFTTKEGLPSNNIEMILTDPTGGLWVATTNNGLAYLSPAGYWTIFNTENSKIPSDFINTLLLDKQGRLWVGTVEGMAYYQSDGSWIEVFAKGEFDLPDVWVESIQVDEQDGVWVGTRQGHLYYREPIEQKWTIFNSENSSLPINGGIHALLVDGHGGMWIGMYGVQKDEQFIGGGLGHRDVAGKWQFFDPNNSQLSGRWVTSLSSDNKDGLWLGTLDKGLFYLNKNGEWQNFTNPHLPSKGVTCLARDRNQGLWIGSFWGISNFNSRQEWLMPETDIDTVPSNTAFTSLVDRQNRMWIGTLQDGLAYYDSNRWTLLNTRSGFPTNRILALALDDSDGLWIGTNKGLIHRQANGQLTQFTSENSILPYNNVNTILADGQGGVWLGAIEDMNAAKLTGSGLLHLDNQGQWTVLNTENSQLPYNVISALAKDEKNGLWIGTQGVVTVEERSGGGLAYLSSDNQWAVFKIDNSPIPSNNIQALLPDGKGGLWVGMWYWDLEHRGGVAFLSADQQWKKFDNTNSKLFGDWTITSLSEDGNGGIWIGTSQGLVHRSSTPQWTTFDTNNSGLPDNFIYTLSHDSQGGLWVGTQNGLAHLTFGNKTALCQQVATTQCSDLQNRQRAAIVIAGGGAQSENNLWDTTAYITNYIYNVLTKKGFDNDEIYYLNAQNWADSNNDGFDDKVIDAPKLVRPITVSDIKEAFEWAKAKGRLDTPLYLFFVDHGSVDALQLSKTEKIAVTEFKALLDDYQQVTQNEVIVLIDACYSGSFSKQLEDPLFRRDLISSTDDTVAYFDRENKQSFSLFFAKQLNNSSFRDAFQQAVTAQTKLLEDISKRFANSASKNNELKQEPQFIDGSQGVLAKHELNYFPLLTGDDSLAVENATPPQNVQFGQPITLIVKTSGMVNRVWAVIRPPKVNFILDTEGTPLLPYIYQNLSRSADNGNTWQTTWNDATYNGTYTITFYAEDNEKNIASSDQDAILTVSGGIEPPVQAQVQIQLDKTRYQRGEQFKATLTEDLGWGYDLYAAVVMPNGNYFTLKNTNELRGLKEAKPWYMSRKQGQPITLLDLTLPPSLPTGQYCLYGILSPEQNDVFEAMNKNLWVYGQQCFEVF